MDSQSTTRTLADRSDLAPRARTLLSQQLGECGELLQPLLRGVLEDFGHALFEVAERSTSGQAQHEAMQALAQVRQRRSEFHVGLMALLARRFASVGQPADQAPDPDSDGPAGGLALVDPHELDETMALEDLSTRIELRAGNALFDLGHRYAVLVAAPPLENDALPPGPRALAQTLGELAWNWKLEQPQRLLLYRVCERRLSGSAESLYTHLNQHLKAGGILADLRSYLPRRHAATPPTTPTPDVQEAEPVPPMAPATNFTPPAAPGFQSPNDAELHGLLASRRRALHADLDAAAAQSAAFASMPELQDALAALQAMPARKAGPQSGEHLTGEVLSTLRRSAPAGGDVQLQPEHRDALDLVGLLYDALLKETRAKGVAQQLLGSLQVPLLRIALADDNFFTVRDHPARRLLNLVLETANLWLDQSDEKFDSALSQRLQRSVEHIAAKFDGDMGVVEREADELAAHMQLLTRRAEIAERRQVEAAKGRDRLREARSAAGAAIEQRLAGKNTTPLVRALLENAWTDALTLTQLRHGKDSEAYRRRLAAADQLLASPVGRDDTRLAGDLNQGLTQVGLQADEADQITRYALGLPTPPAASGRAAPPSQTELLIHLKSRHAANDRDAAPEAPRKLPLTRSERRALDTLTQAPFGSWFEFTVNQQGQTVARKLSWYNPRSGRCVFLNARGTPAAERTLEQVARLIARGQARPLPPQGAGMIDRAWGTLMGGLRKFGLARQTTTAST